MDLHVSFASVIIGQITNRQCARLLTTLWRKLKAGANAPDKKSIMPLWMLKVARHALNLQFWMDSKQVATPGDDGRDCFTTGQTEDSKSYNKEVKSKGELDLKKAEEKNLNSQEGKDDLAQAKDLIAEAKKAELDHRLEDADALMIQAVELSDAAREGKGGTLKEKKETERVSWLRRIIKLVNRGCKKAKRTDQQ